MITQRLLQEIFSYEDGNLYRKKVLGGEAIGKKAGWTTVCNGRLYKKNQCVQKNGVSTPNDIFVPLRLSTQIH